MRAHGGPELERVGGIDLAGSARRSTGLCLLTSDGRTDTRVALSDDEIRIWMDTTAPRLVLIDAPLTLPRGRTTLEHREPVHFRECDRELRRLGIRFFPLTIGPMRTLTARGIALRKELESAGFCVREGYPGGSQDLWGMPRKQAGVERLRAALRQTGCWGAVDHTAISHDELDAVTLALVARAHLRMETITIGDPDEGVMVLPRPGSTPSRRTFGFPRRSPSLRPMTHLRYGHADPHVRASRRGP